jgi:predicted phosphoribosyltransferase
MMEGRLHYRNRVDAGRRLADALLAYKGRRPLVVGIPRGGVPVAAEVARRLDGGIDVVVARKVGTPGQEELALGAVTANGVHSFNARLLEALGLSESELSPLVARTRAEARRREEAFRGGRGPLSAGGRIVIVVDDGLATGSTMTAAVRALRGMRPERLIVAVPVGSPDAVAALREEADEVVCLATPDDFMAVGEFYEDFTPTSDAEVVALLEVERSRAPSPAGPAGAVDGGTAGEGKETT